MLPSSGSSETSKFMALTISGRPLTAEAQVRSRPVHVGFVVDRVAKTNVFLRVTTAFPCHDSTDTPCLSIRYRRYVISVVNSVIKYHTLKLHGVTLQKTNFYTF